MKNFTKLIFAFLFTISQIFSVQAQDLTLTGVMDFTVPGGGSAGKAVHVTALDNISDLSDYGVSVASNGNGPDAAEEYTFPAISVNSGDDILLARDTTVMLAYLSGCSGEFEHVLYATSSVTQNGDDAIQLWHNGVWVETFGDPNVDGTGETWEYVDTWAYRTSTTVANLSTKISDCGDFDAGPTAWPYVLTAVTASQGSISQGPQTFSMNVTSLPTGGATFRVYKTTANGSAFFGPPQTMTLGANGITVGGVGFDRTVKFQFSSGDVEFDDLVLNGTSSDCPIPPPPSSLISDCGDFTAGPTAWPFVLTAVTASQGSISQGPQTFSMNVTSLPTGGANFRVYKTTANGSDFFGPPQAMTLGANGITVGGVSFDRTVKFQFSSGDVIFDDLVLNGVTSGCAGPPAFVESDWNVGALNCTDGTTTIYDASCMYPICNNDFVLNMTDSWGDGWNGNTWTATGTTSGTVYGPFTISTGSTGSATFSSSDYCFTITCGGGSFASEVGWSLEDGAGTVLLAGGAPFTGNYGNCTLGCTDPNSSSYDPSADIDDGSCTYAPCGALAPTHETFSTGLLPVGTCVPNQWEISAVAGDGWRFIGTPGYNAGSNGRTAGEYTWIDFSGTDTDPVLEVEDVDASGLTAPGIVFDYFSDLGTYSCANNILHVEAYDGTSWVSVTSLQLQATGWNTYAFSLAGMENTVTSMMQVRFRGESSGSSCDFYNDLLLDDVKVEEIIFGCTDPNYDNYDATAQVDDGSCTNNYTLYMFDSFGDGWNGNTWTATGLNSGTVYGPFTISTGATDTAIFSTADLCFSITCGGGSWQGEVSWDLHDGAGTSVLTGGAPYSGDYNNGCAAGCTDPLANNYDPLALVNDGSCIYGCVDSDTTESFEAGLGAWEQDLSDAFDWTAQSGSTLSGSTGPTSAFDGSIYLYTESSGNYSNPANLELPCFDPTTFASATFIFAYHMYGSAMGTLNVDASTDGGVTWVNLWTLSGDQGNQWNEAVVDLSSYTSQIRLRVQGVTGTSFTSDMAIDLLRLQEAPLPGCTDPNATNYDPLANYDDGSCTYLSGCTNTLADNYDPLAYLDDGSCTYTGCTNLTLYMADSFGDGWNGNILNITGSNGYDYGSFTIATGLADTAYLCLPDDCFTVTCGGGSWQGEVSWSIVDDSGGANVLTGGAPFSGSFCTPIVYGCTDPAACAYDPLANFDDGSCTYGDWFTVNMYDSFGDGWNGNHLDLLDTSGTVVFSTTFNTGSFATDSFCLDITSSCYDVFCGDGFWQGEVTWEIVNDTGAIVLSGGAPYNGTFGNCVYGCTDPTAINYDATATVDDGSCTSCDIMTLIMNDSFGDGWNGNRWQLVDLSGNVYYDTTLTTGLTDTLSVCVLAGNCYEVVVGGGAWQGEVSWSLLDNSGTTVLSGGAPYSGNYVGSGCVYGCTEPLADNYDATANLDDGSCSYAACLAADTSESFETGSLGAWQQSTDDNFDWSVGVGFTPSFGTGPSFAYDGSSFLYMEASFPNYPDLSASIYTPCVDLSAWNNPSFVFAYHMYGTDIGTLMVEVSNDGGLSWDSVWALSGDQGDQWYQASVDLTSYSGNAAVRVTGTTGAGFASDFALDLLRFQELPVFACMDPNASNYDPTATDDDGSCLYATTFNVDMGCQVPGSFTSVSVESPNLSCYGGCITLSDPDGDDVWSVTLDLTPGSYIYLYAIDNNSSQENLVDDVLNGNGSCAPYTDFFSYANREIVVGASSVTADDTYGSCDPCIRGCTDPAANNYDSLAVVDNGTCEYDVTFVVDMNCSGLTPTTVAATGPADNWSGNTYLLSDADGDGVWEGTYSVTDNFVYLYVVDSWANSEFNGLFNEMLNGTNSCAPYTDNLSYAYRLAASPSTTSDTYGQCTTCPPGCTDPAASNFDANAQIDDGSCLYAATFNVDMNCEPAGSFGYVHLESPVFGWCGGCVPLSDPDGDGVHSVTVDLPLGNFEYKYAVDGWLGQENLIDDMQNGASCAPVTDYYSYANRLVSIVVGLSTSDTYGSCDTCDQINGCTDPGAVNYDAFATEDDGSCLFSTTFNVDMNCEPAGSFGYVHLESPSFGWCGGCVPMSDPDGDGVHSVTVDLSEGNFEYKYAVDGWAGQENLIDDMQNGASCAPVTDYFSYANRLLDVNGPFEVGSNMVGNSSFNQGLSQWYTNGYGWGVVDSSLDLFYDTSMAQSDAIQGVAGMTLGKTYKVSFYTNISYGAFSVSNFDNVLDTISTSGYHEYYFVAGNSPRIEFETVGINSDLTVDDVSCFEINFENMPISDDTYGSCSECILGCTDSLAFNYSDSAMVDDGSCLYGYNCPAPYPIGLSSSDIYAEMATVHWADANSGSCRVEKYFVRYRPVGDSVWITKAAGIGSGLCNVGLPNTSKVLRNLLPSTTYEFKMKAFYCGGGQSGYSYTDQFTTLAPCPPMANLAVQTFSSNHGKAKFTWDETGPYTFARVALRVNTPGSSWQTAGGFGVNYPTFMVMKFGLLGGTEYRAQGRTFCDPVVTSYRSTWTTPIVWTQPGVAPIRLDGGNAINNLEVYPNPSKDIFNVSFVSEDVQNLEVRVLNLIGEVIYTEGLEQFIGEYTKSINMSSYTKGVYFLEITTNDGVVNKKIVLQ